MLLCVTTRQQTVMIFTLEITDVRDIIPNGVFNLGSLHPKGLGRRAKGVHNVSHKREAISCNLFIIFTGRSYIGELST